MTAIRPLKASEFERLGEIDRSEHVTLGYFNRDGRVVAEPVDWHVPPWDPEGDGEHSVSRHADALYQVLGSGGEVFGAFDGGRLVGCGAVRFDIEPAVAQLAALWVSSSHRRRGIAGQLVRELFRLARQHGAREIYVSATPSESAVGFYTSQGFRYAPPERVNPTLYEQEPEDIHMLRPL